MIRRDMPAVLEIEHDNFEFPWDEDQFIRCLRQRNCIGMVAEIDERVVGFVVYSLHKKHIFILNLAVDAGRHRQGVGRVIVERLIRKLEPMQRNRIDVRVRETNLPAQLFFQRQGFIATRIDRDVFDDSPEDAYLMQFDSSSPIASPQ